jgi:general secretion pathway protein D
MIAIAVWARAGALRDTAGRTGGVLTVLALWLVGPGAGFAQEPGQQIMPNYRDADIRQVIEAVGAVTGRNFLVDPRVNARVTLLSFSPMTPESFYQAFLSTLMVHGYVALESGSVVQIIPDANARQYPGAEPRGEGADIVTQTIELANIGAAQLVPILRPMIPQYGHLAAHPSSNILIISDRASNVQRMIQIIRRIDTAGDEEIEVIPLQNGSANSIVRMLGTLTQTAQAAGGAPTVQAIADERTNSVLLSGSESSRLRYRALIAHLDTPTQAGGDTRVIYLRYADSETLAEKLQTQFGARAGAGGGGGGGDPGAPPGAGGAAAQGVTIWSDEGTNALVINAPARILQDIVAVVDQIDIPRAQVLVDAIIVEVSEEKAADFGVTWALDGSGDNQGIGLTNFTLGGGGILQLGAAASGDTPDPSAIAPGVTVGVGRLRDSGTSWAAIISALRGDSSTNVVSTPTIVTLDNEEAEIRVGQEVPFLTGQFTNTGAAAGSVNPFQTIQREEVGTSLKITPQINEGTGVKLTIEQETSQIAPSSSGAVDIVTNSRTITTSVFVEDGDLLVLGGLIDNNLRQSEQRVPVLGRIPGLGWLFRARSADRNRTNLMVFIRPRILRTREDSRFQSNSKYEYLRQLQQELAEEPVRLMRGEQQPILPEPESIPPIVIEPEDEPETETNGDQR